jgi:transcriptional regulator with XRE-family HTH domain
MDELREGLHWRAALRKHRTQRGLSQPEVARRSGLSLSAVKAYERGDRQPSREALDAVLDAVGLTHDEGNPIRAGAGFAIDWRDALDRRYIVDLDDLQQQADALPWPVFVTNQGSYVVLWNRAFERVWDVDVERDFPDPLSRSLLSGASIARFTRCIANYEETMSFFLGLVKGDPREEQNLERPAPWNQDAVQRLFEGDPRELRRLMDAWEEAEPVPHRIRHQYRIVWRHRGVGPVLRFIGQLTVCDIWNELNWQEWVPADAETWARMASLPAPGRRPEGIPLPRRRRRR